MEREKSEYEGAGIGSFTNSLLILYYLNHGFLQCSCLFSYITELMDLCDSQKFKQFISWDGDSVNLQHLKLDRISRKYLLNLEASNKME